MHIRHADAIDGDVAAVADLIGIGDDVARIGHAQCSTIRCDHIGFVDAQCRRLDDRCRGRRCGARRRQGCIIGEGVRKCAAQVYVGLRNGVAGNVSPDFGDVDLAISIGVAARISRAGCERSGGGSQQKRVRKSGRGQRTRTGIGDCHGIVDGASRSDVWNRRCFCDAERRQRPDQTKRALKRIIAVNLNVINRACCYIKSNATAEVGTTIDRAGCRVIIAGKWRTQCVDGIADKGLQRRIIGRLRVAAGFEVDCAAVGSCPRIPDGFDWSAKITGFTGLAVGADIAARQRATDAADLRAANRCGGGEIIIGVCASRETAQDQNTDT